MFKLYAQTGTTENRNRGLWNKPGDQLNTLVTQKQAQKNRTIRGLRSSGDKTMRCHHARDSLRMCLWSEGGAGRKRQVRRVIGGGKYLSKTLEKKENLKGTGRWGGVK